MAISTYKHGNGEIRFRVYVQSRSKINQDIRTQRRASGIKTQREAEREETRLIRECEREVAEKEAQGSSWGVVVEAWIESLKRTESDLLETTRGDYLAALQKHTQCWWKRSAASINALDMKELLAQMKAEGRSYGFQKRFKNMFNRIFVFGIQSGLIHGLDRSPAFGLKLGRPEEKPPEILTYSEIRKLLGEAQRYQHPWYPIWATALLTGMRNGELYALEWGDINWENKTLTVSKSYNKRSRETKCTKAGYWRIVPLSTELITLLKELKTEAAGRRKYVLPRSTKWGMGLQAQVLREFCLGIGIASIKFHTLRACFATQLLRAGVPAIQILKICGWRDLKTMQRYIRMAGIELESVTEQIQLLPTSNAKPLTSKRIDNMNGLNTLATDWLPDHLTT